MSDVKRVALTTISDVKKPNSASETSTKTKKPKTIRLKFNLFEPTAKSFPEFNYAKLIHEEKKKIKKTSKQNGFVSEPENNEDDVARMAREFEKKYGSNTSYGSKTSRVNNLEYCDRGAGYDDEDSFIDNTEAYDEIIPEEIETVGGGFYINSGQLEFKQLSNFERPDDINKMPKPKKRQLSSSSSSSSDNETNDKEVVEEEHKHMNGHVGKKQKTEVAKPIPKQPPKPIIKEKEIKPVPKAKKETGGSDSGKETSKVIKTTTVKDMLRAQRDSMRKKEQVKRGSSETGSSSDGEDNVDDSNKDSGGSSSDLTDSDDSDHSETDKSKQNGSEKDENKLKEVKLPDDLPDYLLQDIVTVKEIAASGGKINFFDAKVSDLLLRIDVSARLCSMNTRNQIYKHLEFHLGCSRQVLMVKIKKIRIQKEDNKVKKALHKLQNAVTDMLPAVLTNYEAECMKVNEIRANAIMNLENGEKVETTVKQPKKKFLWNDNLRNMLYDIVTIRRQSFNILKPKKEDIDEYIGNYLKQHVVQLWPSGWMKYDDIQKELDRRKKSGKPKEHKKVVLATASTVSSADRTSPSTSSTIDVSVVKTTDKPVLEATKNDTKLANSPVTDNNIENDQIKTETLKLEEMESKKTPPANASKTSMTASIAKKSSDHSIISIISSPPASKVIPHSASGKTITPPPPPVSSFDEDLTRTHVSDMNILTVNNDSNSKTALPSSCHIDLTMKLKKIAHSENKRPPTPGALVNLSKRTGDNHLASSHISNNYNTVDEDSDSSVEIIEDYSSSNKLTNPNSVIGHVGKQKPPSNSVNPLTMNLNKDKYKGLASKNKLNSASSSSTSSSSSSASSSSSNFVGVNINNLGNNSNNHNNNNNNNNNNTNNNNTNLEKKLGISLTLPHTASIALRTDVSKTMNNSFTACMDTNAKDNELDVNQIMKELKELQELQRTTKAENNNHKTQSVSLANSHHRSKETEHHMPIPQFLPR